MPRRVLVRELLDAPEQTCGRDELAGSLADIRIVNRRLGGISTSLGHLDRLSRGLGRLSVLDVATGSADIPAAMVRWARDRGTLINVVALDISPAILGHARRHAAGMPEVRFVLGDGLRLPFAEGSFDVVHCSMALHHFDDRNAGLLLSEISRVARRGYIVCDLRRSWVAWALIKALSRIATSNRLTRNDGPVSVLRSFTPDELSGLAARAGLESARVVLHPFWRMALVGEVV